ncbi:MAG: Rieske 2Fe-2S domain-containing protein [Candidatus Acetothermia bacterium]
MILTAISVNITRGERGTERVVARADEFNDGEMEGVEVNGHEVTLVKTEGEFYAVGPKCTHFGVRLGNGTLHEGKHQAVVDTATGKLEEPPALPG